MNPDRDIQPVPTEGSRTLQVTTTPAAHVSQAERERIAYRAAMDAAKRGSREEHARLWRAYADLCAQRCGAVVEQMEQKMGLT